MAKKTGKTPITYRGRSTEGDSVKSFMEEWSRQQAEVNHVETIDEANDFEIYDEEDNDFFEKGYTVYEMHEMAEENLALLEQIPPIDPPAESNETGDRAQESQTLHDQSAPIEPNSLESQQSTDPSLSKPHIAIQAAK